MTLGERSQRDRENVQNNSLVATGEESCGTGEVWGSPAESLTPLCSSLFTTIVFADLYGFDLRSFKWSLGLVQGTEKMCYLKWLGTGTLYFLE